MHSSPSITRTKVELEHGDEDSCVDQVVMHTLLGRHDILESGLYILIATCLHAWQSLAAWTVQKLPGLPVQCASISIGFCQCICLERGVRNVAVSINAFSVVLETFQLLARHSLTRRKFPVQHVTMKMKPVWRLASNVFKWLLVSARELNVGPWCEIMPPSSPLGS